MKSVQNLFKIPILERVEKNPGNIYIWKTQKVHLTAGEKNEYNISKLTCFFHFQIFGCRRAIGRLVSDVKLQRFLSTRATLGYFFYLAAKLTLAAIKPVRA